MLCLTQRAHNKTKNMNIRYYFQNVNNVCEKDVKDYFSAKKISQISRLLAKKNQDVAQLTIRIEYFERHNAFAAEAEMTVGKKQFVAKEQSHDVLKALDFSVKRLISQLKK